MVIYQSNVKYVFYFNILFPFVPLFKKASGDLKNTYSLKFDYREKGFLFRSSFVVFTFENIIIINKIYFLHAWKQK